MNVYLNKIKGDLSVREGFKTEKILDFDNTLYKLQEFKPCIVITRNVSTEQRKVINNDNNLYDIAFRNQTAFVE